MAVEPAAETESEAGLQRCRDHKDRHGDNGDGRARLTLSGSGQRAFLIDYSTNLVDWQVFGQAPAVADTTTFFDSYTGPRRFYRARRTTP